MYIKAIKFLVKYLPNSKTPGPDSFSGKCYQYLKKKNYTKYTQPLPETRIQEQFIYHFKRPASLETKQGKHIAKNKSVEQQIS